MDPSERIQAVSKFLLESPPGEINDVLNGIRPHCLVPAGELISSRRRSKHHRRRRFVAAGHCSSPPGIQSRPVHHRRCPRLRSSSVYKDPLAQLSGAKRLQAIISHTALVGGSSGEGDASERFIHPRSNITFKFDHLNLVWPVFLSTSVSQTYFQEASDPQPYEPDAAAEPFRYVSHISSHSSLRNSHRTALETSAHAYLSSHFPDGTTSVFTSPDSPTVFTIQIIANRYNPSNFWYVHRPGM
jgi:capping protein alpha